MQHLESSADGSLVVMRDQSGYHSLVSRRAFAASDSLGAFSARDTLAQPSRLSVQVAADRHILLAPGYFQYTNHSCDPNVCFDTALGQVIALRPIAPGDAITFFYPSTEWAMDVAFTCHCGASRCLGTIAGASQLDPAVLSRYWLADHIAAALRMSPTDAG